MRGLTTRTRHSLKICWTAVLIGTLSLSGCANSNGMGGFGGDSCNINQTATGALVGAGAGAVAGALVAKNKTTGALIGAAAGGLIGGAVGNQADQVCRQKAEKQALDAAVLKYQASQRAAADAAAQKAEADAAAQKAAADAAAQKAAADAAVQQQTASAQPPAKPKKKPVPANVNPPAPVAPSAPPLPPEPKYDEISWNASSGTTGSVAPDHIYTDTASNSICATRKETVTDSSGKAVATTVKSCRGPDGSWVDSI